MIGHSVDASSKRRRRIWMSVRGERLQCDLGDSGRITHAFLDVSERPFARRRRGKLYELDTHLLGLICTICVNDGLNYAVINKTGKEQPLQRNQRGSTYRG